MHLADLPRVEADTNQTWSEKAGSERERGQQATRTIKGGEEIGTTSAKTDTERVFNSGGSKSNSSTESSRGRNGRNKDNECDRV